MQESGLSFSPFRGAVLLPFLHWHCPYTEQRHSPSKKKEWIIRKWINITIKKWTEKCILSLWMRESVEWILNNWLGRNLEEKLKQSLRRFVSVMRLFRDISEFNSGLTQKKRGGEEKVRKERRNGQKGKKKMECLRKKKGKWKALRLGDRKWTNGTLENPFTSQFSLTSAVPNTLNSSSSCVWVTCLAHTTYRRLLSAS